MRSVVALSLSCLPAALGMIDLRRTSFEALAGINKRQFQFCGSVPAGTPNPCEVACGPGNQICISLPTCFNPTAGETCCEDGSYCPAGYFCTDGGCCPEGSSVEDCGATQIIATVPGIDNPSSATASSSASSTASATTSLSSPSYSSSTPSPPPSYSSPTATPPIATPSTNVTSPTVPSPPIYTGGAAVKGQVAGWAVGGLAALGLGFMI